MDNNALFIFKLYIFYIINLFIFNKITFTINFKFNKLLLRLKFNLWPIKLGISIVLTINYLLYTYLNINYLSFL